MAARVFATILPGSRTLIRITVEMLAQHAELDGRAALCRKLGVRRSGSTDTITSADLSLRKDGVNA